MAASTTRSISLPGHSCLRRPRAPQRVLRLPVRAAAADASTEAAMQQALGTLRAAVSTGMVPPADVLQAMLAMDKAKQDPEDWPRILGGTASPGNRWRLVFTTGTKDVQAAMKKAEGEKGGHGRYFPVTAVQRWDGTKNEIENGIFFGHLAALTFLGPYVFQGKRLYFDFDQLKLKIGPKTFQFPLKAKIDPSTLKPSKDMPFFIFLYVDEDMVVARGRSGGLAVWARATPSWQLQNGIL